VEPASLPAAAVAPGLVVAPAAVADVAGGGDERGLAMSTCNPRHLRACCAGFATASWLLLAQAADAQSPAQQTFASPDEAAGALATATRTHNMTALRAILGPDSEKLLSTGDRYADQEQERRFAEAYDEKHQLLSHGPDDMELEVGANDWPLPIPIVRSDGRWHFDTKAGAQEIIDRRIGRNELAAIRVALTYVEAQKDYFELMKQQTGTGYYAERLLSTAGRHDGLYWPVAAGGEESPFGPLVAQAEEEGYPAPGALVGGKPIPYQGYYFRILRAQGPSAPGGAMNYAKSGRMTRGFALVAWPSSYGSSGVMSFQVNQDGVVFQKDLGTDTARVASAITQFDPDLSWARVEVTNQ
jgi:hypothetical protein